VVKSRRIERTYADAADGSAALRPPRGSALDSGLSRFVFIGANELSA